MFTIATNLSSHSSDKLCSDLFCGHPHTCSWLSESIMHLPRGHSLFWLIFTPATSLIAIIWYCLITLLIKWSINSIISLIQRCEPKCLSATGSIESIRAFHLSNNWTNLKQTNYRPSTEELKLIANKTMQPLHLLDWNAKNGNKQLREMIFPIIRSIIAFLAVRLSSQNANKADTHFDQIHFCSDRTSRRNVCQRELYFVMHNH